MARINAPLQTDITYFDDCARCFNQEIAFEHGFCDQSHFHRVFKKFAGVTPAEFRREFS